MDKLQEKTIDLAKDFSGLKKKEHIFMDLIEETGELATAILYTEKIKKGKNNGKLSRDDIADALADMLFDMFLLADKYDIDLNKEYQRIIERLKMRVKKGEFK